MRSVLEPTAPTDQDAPSPRRRIIGAMIDSCAEKSYAATRISDLVSRASISRTTFYKNFAGKRECFDAALDSCIEDLRAAAAGSHSSSDPAPTVVRKAATAMLNLMAARPALAQLVVGEAVAVESAVVERYRRLLIPGFESLWEAAGRPHDPHADPRLAFGRAQVLVYNQIITAGTAGLPDLLPEIVYISLLPYAGHEEALKQARFAGGDGSPGRGGG